MVILSVLNDVPEYIPTKRIIFSTNLKTEATGQRLGIPVYNSRALKARGVMLRASFCVGGFGHAAEITTFAMVVMRARCIDSEAGKAPSTI